MSGFRASEDALHEQAVAAAGLDDFGEPDYLEGLRALLGSLDDEAPLNEIGVAALRGMIVGALVARLRSEQGFKQFPESAEAAVDAPLVIIGLPRTGTTALHHLISQDVAFQGLELWITGAPQPKPPRSAWEADPDFRACAERMRLIHEHSPHIRAIHPMEAHLVDECWHLLEQHFGHSGYEANTEVPGYAKWWAQCDMRPAYRRHGRNLQLIGHRAPERRWLLKDATHLFHLDAFLDTYPDARIVMTHRDPVKLIPSVCSLCWAHREPLNARVDRRAFGRSTLALWERAITHTMEVRERVGSENFMDLPFARFRADALGAIRDIYERFDLPFTPTADQAIRQFRAEHPPGAHGAHDYSLDEWGLDAGEIRERFASYSERFGVPEEG